MYVEGLATRATPQMGRFQRFSLHLAPPSGKMNTCALMPPPVLESVVSDIFELTPTVKTFRLRLPKGVDAGFKAGQFCSVHILREDKILRKPYSICSAPYEKEYLDLCIKRVEGGFVSSFFCDYLKVGAILPLQLPYGHFTMKEPYDYEFVFVATGTGLAPLRSMTRQLIHDGVDRPIWLFFGARYEDDLLYDDEWRALEKKHSNFNYIPCVSRPEKWDGERGYVQDAARKYLTSPAEKQVYLCGLVPMVESCKVAFTEMGFGKDQIHFEKYV